MYLGVLEPKFIIKLNSKKLEQLGKARKKAPKPSFYEHLNSKKLKIFGFDTQFRLDTKKLKNPEFFRVLLF